MRNKKSRHRKYGLFQPLEVPKRPWKSIEMDFLCGLPHSKGFKVIMVVVDRFSKMVHFIPFKDIPNASQTAKDFIKHIFIGYMGFLMKLYLIEVPSLLVNSGKNFF